MNNLEQLEKDHRRWVVGDDKGRSAGRDLLIASLVLCVQEIYSWLPEPTEVVDGARRRAILENMGKGDYYFTTGSTARELYEIWREGFPSSPKREITKSIWEDTLKSEKDAWQHLAEVLIETFPPWGQKP